MCVTLPIHFYKSPRGSCSVMRIAHAATNFLTGAIEIGFLLFFFFNSVCVTLTSMYEKKNKKQMGAVRSDSEFLVMIGRAVCASPTQVNV